jgi:hypothetical protein
VFKRQGLKLELDEAGEAELKRLVATLAAEMGAIQEASRTRQRLLGTRLRRAGVAIVTRRANDE